MSCLQALYSLLQFPNLEVDCKMQIGADGTTEKKKTGLKGKDVIIEYYTVSPFPVCQTACSALPIQLFGRTRILTQAMFASVGGLSGIYPAEAPV